MNAEGKSYREEFCGLDFATKHAVLANLASMVLAAVSLGLGIYVFRAQYVLQRRQQDQAESQWETTRKQLDLQLLLQTRQQELDERIFLIDQNRQERADAREAARADSREAFGLSSIDTNLIR